MRGALQPLPIEVPRTRPAARAQRGATAVIVAICLVMLCGFLALALNVGHILSVKGELQNAADSAALAGAQDLDGTLLPITSTISLEGAIASGTDFAERHATDTATQVDVKLDDIQLGYWNVADRKFTKVSPETVTEQQAACLVASPTTCINAVRASTHRNATHSGAVDVAFGALLGRLTRDVGAEAVAVTGGPCGMKCIGLPIVLPDCGVDPLIASCDNDGAVVDRKYKVMFKSANTDTGAWADLGSGADTAKCLLKESLGQSNVQTCSPSTACKVDTSLAVTEDVGVINGQINSACDLITQLYKQHPLATYVVPVVEGALCTSDDQWVKNWVIEKFSTVRIAWAPPDCSADNKFFWVEILCDQVTNNATSGGCAAAGTWVRPGLVK